MANAKNALLQVESGTQDYSKVLMTALTTGKYKTSAALWSGADGKTPTILPNGVQSGLAVTVAASGSNDVFDVSGGKVYLAGVLTTVSASVDLAITRPVTDVGQVFAITVTSAGAIAVVEGVDSADSTTNEVFGSAGGPPLIPVGSVMLGQIRISGNTPAAILDSELFDNSNQHREMFNFPVWSVHPLGDSDGNAAHIEYSTVPLLCHTGGVAKQAYCSYSVPTMTELPYSRELAGGEKSSGIAVDTFYSGMELTSEGDVTTSQITWKSGVGDGITDLLYQAVADKLLTVRFYPDRAKAPHKLMQGRGRVATPYPASGNLIADVTLSPTTATVIRQV